MRGWRARFGSSPARMRNDRPTWTSSSPHHEGWDRSSQRPDQRADLLTENHAFDVARLEQVEHHYGHVIVHAQGEGSVVHHLDAAVEHFEIVEMLELDRVRVELRIGGVDPVDLGRLKDDVRL